MFNAERGIDARSVLLVDAQGIIRHSHAYPKGSVPESEDLLKRLAEI